MMSCKHNQFLHGGVESMDQHDQGIVFWHHHMAWPCAFCLASLVDLPLQHPAHGPSENHQASWPKGQYRGHIDMIAKLMRPLTNDSMRGSIWTFVWSCFFWPFFPGLLQGGCWKRTVDDRLVDVLMSWNHMITNGNVTLDSVLKSGI